MPRYNIALLPDDPTISERLTRYSQERFGATHDDYLLGPKGLPHITLCQFRAKHDEAALNAFENLSDKTPIVLTTTKLYARPGTPPANAGKFIVVVGIEKTPELLSRQRDTVACLAQNDAEPLTKVETYSPHITVTRLSEEPSALPMIESFPFGLPLRFRPDVGLSTESGVLVRRLIPSAR
ncbi:MAG: hypothetical protein ABTQ34_07675 [Bdellovibrionales bacterium]